MEHKTSLDSESLVDFTFTLSLRVKDFTTLDTLALSLQFHAAFDLLGRLDVLDLVAHAVDSPLAARFVQSLLHFVVQVFTLLERAIEFEQADFTSHGSLGKKGNSSDWLSHAVRCLKRVLNLEVKHSVDFDLDIVFRDGCLRVDVQHLLFQRVLVGDGFSNWNLPIESWTESAGVLAEALNDRGGLLSYQVEWHEPVEHHLHSLISNLLI